MRRQEIACHRLGSQWRHSTTHESVSIVKTKTDIIETQQRATWLQKTPKKSVLTLAFVVALVSRANDVTGCLAALL